MMHGNWLKLAAATGALLLLGACTSVDNTVKGLYQMAVNSVSSDQDQGDDIVRRPALTLPPDFNLRPPQTGSGTSDYSTSLAARQTVFGLNNETAKGNVQKRAGLSLGESALLQHAGATPALSTGYVRGRVDKQTTTMDQQQQTFVNSLLNPQQSQKPAEQKDADTGLLGTILSTGSDQKPTIERKSDSGGFFGGLF